MAGRHFGAVSPGQPVGKCPRCIRERSRTALATVLALSAPAAGIAPTRPAAAESAAAVTAMPAAAAA